MKRRFAAVICAAAVMLTGCGKGNVTDNAPPAAETAVSSLGDGWKMSDINSVTLYGTEFALPCKATDFTGDFDAAISDYTPADENLVYYDITYQSDKPAGTLVYRKGDDLNDDPLAISFDGLCGYDIKGITRNSPKTEVQRILGKGNQTDSGETDIYQLEDGNLQINYYDYGNFIFLSYK